ncbi:MAG: hypothetical protein IPK94_04995 [Saprospiraceae bacterium]|nr:hypothetical protein [Saprospiraceae bacterium]
MEVIQFIAGNDQICRLQSVFIVHDCRWCFSLVFSEFKDLLALGLAFKILIALLVASSGFLILYSMKTMMPRASTKTYPMKSQKLIYFLDIASQEDHEFVQHFFGASDFQHHGRCAGADRHSQ